MPFYLRELDLTVWKLKMLRPLILETHEGGGVTVQVTSPDLDLSGYGVSLREAIRDFSANVWALWETLKVSKADGFLREDEIRQLNKLGVYVDWKALEKKGK